MDLGLGQQEDQGDIELDSSWIETEENQEKKQDEIIFVRQPLHEIKMIFVYIDENHCIEHVSKEKEILSIDVSNTSSVISKERLLQIIQTKKNEKKHKKYKLFDILAYQIYLENDQLHLLDQFSHPKGAEMNKSGQLHLSSKMTNGVNGEEENLKNIPILKSVPIFQELKLLSSLPIFHKLHTLYFFFKKEKDNGITRHLKSILKSGNNANKVTKKVRIA